MATYTVTIPDHLVPGVNRQVARYNAHAGTQHTTEEWLAIHLMEIATNKEVAAEAQRLREAAETDVVAALEEYKTRLFADDTPVAEGEAE